MKKLLLLINLLVSTIAVNAQLLFKDEFNYPAGNLAGQGNWIAFSAAGANPVKVVSETLSFPGYKLINNDGKAIRLSPTASAQEDVEALFSTAASTGMVYVSYMIKIDKTTPGSTSSPAEFMSLNSTGSINRARLAAVENSDECYKFVLGWNGFSSGHKISSRSFDYGTTYLVVLKYEIIEGANNDKVSLFVFNPGTPMPASEPVSAEIADVNGTGDMNPVGKIRFNQLGGSSYPQNMTIDGIAVVRSWTNFFDTTLPVIRRSLTHERTFDNIRLKWSTFSEKENSHFRILKRSPQTEFQELGTVKGNGDRSGVSEYSYVDTSPVSGNNYYKIQQVDLNGLEHEFGTLVAAFEGKQNEKISVFASSTSVEVDITVTVLNKDARLKILDSGGKLLYSMKDLRLQPGSNKFSVPLAPSPGIYVINVESSQGLSLTTKFIKGTN